MERGERARYVGREGRGIDMWEGRGDEYVCGKRGARDRYVRSEGRGVCMWKARGD